MTGSFGAFDSAAEDLGNGAQSFGPSALIWGTYKVFGGLVLSFPFRPLRKADSLSIKPYTSR